jgi:uncharacterized membrane protein YczE
VARAVRLVGWLAVLGIGVGLVLTARLGSDGYSSLVNGAARRTGLPYAPVNWVIGFTLVVLAWWRGGRPGPATLAHPIVVGSVVDLVLATAPTLHGLLPRAVVLVAGVLLLSVGVVGYLATGLGSGPFEGAARALAAIPFGWAYFVLQAAGAVIGWRLGADLGLGTVLVVFGVAPCMAAVRWLWPAP